MPSDSSTPNTNIDLMATGNDIGTWGVVTNANWSINDLNMGGRLNISVAGSSDVTLTQLQSENLYHVITGALTGNINYILPVKGRFFILNNDTTGAFILTAKPAGGTGIVIPQNTTVMIFVNPDTMAVTQAFDYIINGQGNDKQVFTSSGTWTKPNSLIANAMTLVQIWGSGGSGGAGDYAGGGGGGSYKEAWFLTSSLGSTETVTVGAGGAVQNSTNTNGNPGSLSSFGSWLTAYGGAGGAGSSSNAYGGGGGGWLVNSTNRSNDTPSGEGYGGLSFTAPFIGYYAGGGGGQSSNLPTSAIGASSVFGGGGGGNGGGSSTLHSGGTSIYGGAGGAGTTSGAAAAGTQPGGGGGGSPSGSNSGKGGDGKIIVTTFST